MSEELSDIKAILKTTPARWSNLLEGVSAALAMRPPAPGEWSAVECLLHLMDTERWVFPSRMEALVAGRDFPAFDPDSEGTKLDPGMSPADLAAEFAQMRAESMEALGRVTAADLDRRARHAELGPVTLRELLNEWAAHDLNHTVQAEVALIQPFIERCGPWQIYFTNLAVGAGPA